MKEDQRRHVDTKQKSADLASRGTSVNMLIGNNLWFEGPAFLKCQEQVWPQTMINDSFSIDDLEIKTAVAAPIDTSIDDNNRLDMMMLKFSSWERLRKTMAWILRYDIKLN
ncbi:uncharacterized protein LOC117102970 [Anneissia japonica]|uniref:uncharacterized protein LOC117102970 n=1 Tax=Anneissia japonica TaxID=1529436 RepID=UPI0014256889|nr:uncharacterized protein LOC117102970 [Anneissia japonica]